MLSKQPTSSVSTAIDNKVLKNHHRLAHMNFSFLKHWICEPGWLLTLREAEDIPWNSGTVNC